MSWTVVHQAPLSMEFFRQEYWSGLPFPSPGDLLDPGIKPYLLHFLRWQAGSLAAEPLVKSMTLNKTLAFGTLVSLCEELGWGTSLVVQWLSLQASTAEGMDLNPGQGTKIPHAAWWSQKVGGKKWMRMIKSIPSSCWNPCIVVAQWSAKSWQYISISHCTASVKEGDGVAFVIIVAGRFCALCGLGAAYFMLSVHYIM